MQPGYHDINSDPRFNGGAVNNNFFNEQIQPRAMGGYRGAGSVGPLGRTGLSGAHSSSFNGEYGSSQQDDRIQVRIRGKNNALQQRTGSVTKTLGELDTQRKQKKELSQATQRLKVLGQLEHYREEKIQKEMLQLEIKRQQEEGRIQKMIAQDRKK